MLKLSDRWGPRLVNQPETGMGYQIATIILLDGRRFHKASIVGGIITKIKNVEGIPFTESEIEDIVVTH